jgi:hypothetical protein
MSAAGSELKSAKDWLAKTKIHEAWNNPGLVKYMEQIASRFIPGATPEQQRINMAEFHNCAGRLPYYQDSDIGALVLEAAADASSDEQIRSLLYGEARLRAIWCAQGATAGGEGIARMMHVKRLEQKF